MVLFDEESLLHQLYKARYFHDCDFMEAKLGHAPSYTWKGIWETRRLLNEGCRWRVGDGRSIHIITDNWILGFGKLNRAQSMISTIQLDEKVITLINTKRRC